MRRRKAFVFCNFSMRGLRRSQMVRCCRVAGVVVVGFISSFGGWVGATSAAVVQKCILQKDGAIAEKPTIDQRLERIRAEAHRDTDTAGEMKKYRERLAQWYNWPNWPNSWGNWNNWPNNWYNY